MLSKTLRIGPLFLIEILALAAGIVVQTSFNQRCWSLALVQSSISIFLFESILAYYIIGRSKRHRKEYLCRMATLTNSKLYLTIAWNQLILIGVMLLFAMNASADLQRLLQGVSREECVFDLYPLCLEYQSELTARKQADQVQMWLLFFLYASFNVFLIGMLQFRQYRYTLTLLKNRKELAREYLGMEVLLAGSPTEMIYDGKPHQYRNNGECSICLNNIEVGDLLTNLYCNHSFHSACLKGWLDKREQCPYRCNPSLVVSE